MAYPDMFFSQNATNASINSSTLDNCRAIPSLTPEYIVALKITVGTTCLLSIFGASLIILTYVAFRDLRTTARQLLVNLSVADIVVAASHFVGLLAILDLYREVDPCSAALQYNGDILNITDNVDNTLCRIQGGFTVFGTISSFLWTIAVALYLFIVIVVDKPLLAKRLRVVFYPVCWGIPAVLVIVFGVEGFLGFEENLDVGWCYVRWIHDNHTSQKRNLLPQVLGYQVWVYLNYLTLPILYLSIRCYVRFKLSKAKQHISTSLRSKAKTADLKLVFIPLIFLILRVWDITLSFPLLYLSFDVRQNFRTTVVNAVLVLLAGIGTSAQGFANAILFCACTKVVRQKLLGVVMCRYKKKKRPCVCLHSTSSRATPFEESTNYREDSSDNIPGLLINADASEEPLLYHSTNRTMSHPHTCTYNATAQSLPNGTDN